MSVEEDVVCDAEIDQSIRKRVVAFLVKEARYLDEQRYDEWELLFDDEVSYLVPLKVGPFDPTKDAAIISDNRKRLVNRLKQLRTGKRFAQDPPSIARRQISNVEIGRLSVDEFQVECNFSVFEYRVQSMNEIYVWAGRLTYGLRMRSDDIKLFRKRVDLINAGGPIPTLAFII